MNKMFVFFFQAEDGIRDGTVTGVQTCALPICLLMYGISKGPLKSWSSPDVVFCCVAGAALLTIFVFVELRNAHPMVDLHLLSNRLFRSTNVVMFLVAAAFLGMLYLIPLY